MEYLEGGPLPAAVLLYILTSMTPFALRVLIVADDPLARAGIAALLADQALVTVAGLAGSDGDIPAAVTVFAPDAVIWDLGWDLAGRIDALSRFCDDSSLPVIALVASATSVGEVQAAGAVGC